MTPGSTSSNTISFCLLSSTPDLKKALKYELQAARTNRWQGNSLSLIFNTQSTIISLSSRSYRPSCSRVCWYIRGSSMGSMGRAILIVHFPWKSQWSQWLVQQSLYQISVTGWKRRGRAESALLCCQDVRLHQLSQYFNQTPTGGYL